MGILQVGANGAVDEGAELGVFLGAAVLEVAEGVGLEVDGGASALRGGGDERRGGLAWLGLARLFQYKIKIKVKTI